MRLEIGDSTFRPWINGKRTSVAYWEKPLHWNNRADVFRECGGCGWRGEIVVRAEPIPFACPSCDCVDWRDAVRRVFCEPDVFDKGVPDEWLRDLWDIIEETPNLDWLICTKRIRNVWQMQRCSGWFEARRNAWLGVQISTQEEYDRDIPKLLAVPAAVRFLSIEPMLGPVDLRIGRLREWNKLLATHHGDTEGLPEIDWVIAAGDAGKSAMPAHPDWIRSLRDQCKAAGVPFNFDAWGEWSPGYAEHGNDLGYDMLSGAQQREWPEGFASFRVGKQLAGRLLDGVLHDEYPEVMV